MQIRGTQWYTACGTYSTPLKGGERAQVQTVYGYRMSVQNKDIKELKELLEQLKSNGINARLKTSKHDHTGIPKGTPFLEVLDEKSAIALEEVLWEQGIELSKDRYKEYGLEYINRTARKLSPPVKKSFFVRLFRRR